EKGQPSPVKSKEYKGVTAWSLGKDEYHAILQDTLVISNKQEGMKTALDMNSGEGPKPISELAMWKEARGRLPHAPVAWAFARLDILRQAGFGKDFYQEKAPNAGLPILFGGLSHVLNQAPYAAASLVLDEGHVAVRVELPRDGKAWPPAY